MRLRYPGDGDPSAVPGRCPGGPEGSGPSFTLEVDGELFEVRPEQNDTHYAWLSGPNDGYGFSLSGPRPPTLGEHHEHIHDFLAGIDPTTGYLAED